MLSLGLICDGIGIEIRFDLILEWVLFKPRIDLIFVGFKIYSVNDYVEFRFDSSLGGFKFRFDFSLDLI